MYCCMLCTGVWGWGLRRLNSITIKMLEKRSKFLSRRHQARLLAAEHLDLPGGDQVQKVCSGGVLLNIDRCIAGDKFRMSVT